MFWILPRDSERSQRLSVHGTAYLGVSPVDGRTLGGFGLAVVAF